MNKKAWTWMQLIKIIGAILVLAAMIKLMGGPIGTFLENMGIPI